MKSYYDQKNLWDRPPTEELARRVEAVKRFIPGDVETILDAGCGNGAVSNTLKGYDITAADRSEEALRHVKHRAVCADIAALPFADDSFDLVLCSDVLEHLDDGAYRRAVAELSRVARRYILVLSPNEEDLRANQSKCRRCSTVFHMNWHLRSLSVEEVVESFRDGFSPLCYGFFGEEWASEPPLKYTLARQTDRGYKSWEHAVCPLCGTRQEKRETPEDTGDIDRRCNAFLGGFFNRRTEFAVLFSAAGEPLLKEMDDTGRSGMLLAQKALTELPFAGRRVVDFGEKVFRRERTCHYPRHAYAVGSGGDGKRRNRMLVCFPYFGAEETPRLHLEYEDRVRASVRVNVYDAEKSYLPLGTVVWSGGGEKRTAVFDVPAELVVANEGLMFEIVPEDGEIAFERLRIRRARLDGSAGSVPLVPEGKAVFLGREYVKHRFGDFRNGGDEFLLAAPGTLLYDRTLRCFYLTLEDTFDFFNPTLKETDEALADLEKMRDGALRAEAVHAARLAETLQAQVKRTALLRESLERERRTRKTEREEVREALDALREETAQLRRALESGENARRRQSRETQELKQALERRIAGAETALEGERRLREAEGGRVSRELDRFRRKFDALDAGVGAVRAEVRNRVGEAAAALARETERIAQGLAGVQREVYGVKEGLYTVSNTVDSLLAKLRHPLRALLASGRKKPAPAGSRERHLVVLTPDVRVDRRTVQMCRSLTERFGIRCTIVAALSGEDDFVTRRLRVRRIDPGRSKKHAAKTRPEERFDLEAFYWLHPHYVHAGLDEKPDWVMCCDLPVLPAAVRVARDRGVPLVYDAHELYPEQAAFPPEKKRFYSEVERAFIGCADRVITVNESIAEEMAKRYAIEVPEVILNALDAPEDFDPAAGYDYFRQHLPIGRDRKIVLFQGGYSPYRNLEALVGAAKHLDGDIVIVLMGFGEHERVLRAIAERDGTLESRVFFFPAVAPSVLLHYSASADAGIIPYPHVDLNSYYCTPNKLFEFIQAGLPVIANDSPELNRFVRGYGIGRTAKMEDERDIAAAVSAFFAEDADYTEPLRAAAEKICWREEEKKFVALFREVLRHRPAARKKGECDGR